MIIFLVPHQGKLRESMDLEDFREKSMFFRKHQRHVDFHDFHENYAFSLRLDDFGGPV